MGKKAMIGEKKCQVRERMCDKGNDGQKFSNENNKWLFTVS